MLSIRVKCCLKVYFKSCERKKKCNFDLFFFFFFTVNKHKPWIETSYHGVIAENMDTVLLDPPLVALDKDAPVPYAGRKFKVPAPLTCIELMLISSLIHPTLIYMCSKQNILTHDLRCTKDLEEDVLCACSGGSFTARD